jgi:ankyrin repeat protein
MKVKSTNLARKNKVCKLNTKMENLLNNQNTYASEALAYKVVNMLPKMKYFNFNTLNPEAKSNLIQLAYNHRIVLDVLSVQRYILPKSLLDTKTMDVAAYNLAWVAINHGNFDFMRFVLSKLSLTIDSLKNGHGNTPLHLAAQDGFNCNNKAVIDYFSNSNMADKPNDIGQLPLHYAAYYKDIANVFKLIGLTKNINHKDYLKCTPAHMAANKINSQGQDNYAVLELLIKHGADTKIANNSGYTIENMMGESALNDCVQEVNQIGVGTQVDVGC